MPLAFLVPHRDQDDLSAAVAAYKEAGFSVPVYFSATPIKLAEGWYKLASNALHSAFLTHVKAANNWMEVYKGEGISQIPSSAVWVLLTLLNFAPDEKLMSVLRSVENGEIKAWICSVQQGDKVLSLFDAETCLPTNKNCKRCYGLVYYLPLFLLANIFASIPPNQLAYEEGVHIALAEAIRANGFSVELLEGAYLYAF